MMITALPDQVRYYAQTPLFTESTTPEKLTSEHRTKPGVWGKLVVLAGAIDYIVPGPPAKRQHLVEGEVAIIEPEITHHVALCGPVRFQVEFYR